ncbi:MAG: bacillithiol biosynthesis cysteine-adding enzyme BshC [Saprospiraceae bacterium]|nr:bacillithiol biosynthesis cysteine-adding enzyme BshC [Saprospiraceae bacterium]
MSVKKINFDKIKAFTKRDITYRNTPEVFEAFYTFSPNLEGLKHAAKARQEFPVDRDLLVEVLTEQALLMPLTEKQQFNLTKLYEISTFTVITAHQPALFTGPLYYIYKIISAIKLADRLNKELPGNHFVPVFINGSEDHDFEEVNHLHLFGKNIVWNHKTGGPVGRFDLTGIQEVIQEIKSILGESSHAQELMAMLDTCMAGSASYNEVAYKFVNQLFADFGVLILNMDHPKLKSRFKQVMRTEILNHPSVELIKESQEKWHKLGYASQAHAREINLFYMNNGLRERIELNEGIYRVYNTALVFTKEELLEELEMNPDHFSPNVVLRPLYQEYILPNIAYIGGGGELAYWLERKEQFAHFNIFFPALIRRDSVLWIGPQQLKLLEKLKLTLDELLLDEEAIIQIYLGKTTDFDISLSDETTAIENIFSGIKHKAGLADKSLESYTDAEKAKIIKAIEQIELRIKRSLKKNEETSINQIRNLKHKLFPGNGLQERHDNFMTLYLAMGPKFIDLLIEHLNPLQPEFTILEY